MLIFHHLHTRNALGFIGFLYRDDRCHFCGVVPTVFLHLFFTISAWEDAMGRLVGWIRRFIRELRRRRVIRVAVVYAGAGFAILELADILQPALRLPSWTVRLVAVLLGLGFPLAMSLAWVYNLTEAAGDPGRAERLLASDRDIPPFGRGLLHAAIGERNAAFEVFRNADLPRGVGESFRYWFPKTLGPLRDDPRSEALIEETNKQWGLNPDGSIPEDPDPATDLQTNA